MDNFLVKWTKEDRRADMPERLAKAIKIAGASRAPLIRSLLIEWVENIETHGPAQVKSVVARVNERPPSYGRKKGR